MTSRAQFSGLYYFDWCVIAPTGEICECDEADTEAIDDSLEELDTLVWMAVTTHLRDNGWPTDDHCCLQIESWEAVPVIDYSIRCTTEDSESPMFTLTLDNIRFPHPTRKGWFISATGGHVYNENVEECGGDQEDEDEEE